MKDWKRILVVSGALAVVMGAVGVWAIMQWIGRTPAAGPVSDVPVAWHAARDSFGHIAHVAYARVPCADCHEMSGGGFGEPKPGVCQTCHERVDTPLHLAHAKVKQGPTCRECHGFGADHEVEPWSCMRCHDQQQGSIAAVGVHGDQPCGQCHRPHQVPSTVARDCAECHPDQVSEHGGVQGSAQCETCHSPHEAADSADAKCAECHAKTRPIIPATARFKGHDTCTNCHVPHRFSKKQVTPCKSCHNQQRVLAVRTGHKQCLGCHQTHDVRAPRACTTCHRGQKANHPLRAKAGRCVDCHPIHGVPDGAIAVACTTCHKQSSHRTATCTQCHVPHGATPKLDVSLCTRCHGDKARGVAGTGHANCRQCHVNAAHQPEAPRPECRSCHAPIVQRVNPGHQRCQSCHVAAEHGPRGQKMPCASCHKTESATAPAGHQTCTNCHDQHSGARKPIAQACGNCHTAQRQHGHGTKLACQTCHRPHGPKGPASPPTCTTCHDPTKLPGLHSVPMHHRDCKTCHSSHETEPRRDRASCMRCHTDRGNHQPQATKCNGCHVFHTRAGAKATLRPVRPGIGSAPP